MKRNDSPVLKELHRDLKTIKTRRSRLEEKRHLLALLLEIVLGAADAMNNEEHELQNREVDLETNIQSWQDEN